MSTTNREFVMITHKRLKELLQYNKETGHFTWLVARGGKYIGDIAGCLATNKNGKRYIKIRVDDKLYLAHRLAWFYVTGKWPDNEIDHDNGDGTDNKWNNFNEVTHQVNNFNQRLRCTNSSGIMGVYLRKDTKKWTANIMVDGKKISLGCHSNLFDAACARKSAERKYGFNLNHGSIRPL